MIEGANKLKKIIALCGRPRLGLTIKFHDFSGLENNIVKFHDFLQVFLTCTGAHHDSNLPQLFKSWITLFRG